MKKSLVIMAALCAVHSPAIAQSVAPDAEVPWDTSAEML